jgi:hypothetical protein
VDLGVKTNGTAKSAHGSEFLRHEFAAASSPERLIFNFEIGRVCAEPSPCVITVPCPRFKSELAILPQGHDTRSVRGQTGNRRTESSKYVLRGAGCNLAPAGNLALQVLAYQTGGQILD